MRGEPGREELEGAVAGGGAAVPAREEEARGGGGWRRGEWRRVWSGRMRGE